MGNVMPFSFEDHAIRVIADEHGEPLFVGKDLCEALGYANPRKAMGDHCKGVTKRYPLRTAGGVQEVRVLTEGDMFRLIVNSNLPSAERFERLVFDEILPAIRKTGSYTSPDQALPRASAVQLQPVRNLLLVGRAMSRVRGVNEALAMAYTLDAIEKSTGLPATMLAKALPAVAPDEVVTLNATQVGEPLSLSNQAANRMLEELGFQYRDEAKHWNLTEAGTAYGEAKPFHRRGHSGYEIRWKASVVEVLRKHLRSSAASV